MRQAQTDPSSNWKRGFMKFFVKWKSSSTPGPILPNEVPIRTPPGERVGCDVVYEGEGPLKAEYVLSFYCGAPQITAGDPSLVFVHGLGGHWYNTWSKNGVFWPRDLLSRDVRDVRIITFGYGSDVVQFFGQVSQNQIRDHAQTLIADLRRHRRQEGEVRCHETS